MSQLASVHLLSGGAAQGLLDALQAEVAALGIGLAASYGAVGAMQERLLAGAPCDVFISTQAMLADLAQQGRVDAASLRNLGRVATGIAAKAGSPLLAVADAGSLRAALLAAAEVHCPDTLRSTAGIHFAGVLKQLGLADALAGRLRTHPNGMAAMRALAASAEPSALGCTQITEILPSPGVRYAGDLPGELALRTVYAAGLVLPAGPALEPARALLALLGGEQARSTRENCGFLP